MALNLDDVGIQSIAGITLLQSVDYEKKLDVATVSSCTSAFGAAEAYNPIIEFSMKGAGDLPAGLVIGSDGSTDADLTDVNDGTGIRIITNVKEMEKNDDFNGWECSGTYFPNAVVA